LECRIAFKSDGDKSSITHTCFDYQLSNLRLFLVFTTLNINTGKQTKQVKSNYTTLPLKQPLLYVRQVDTYQLLGFRSTVKHLGVDLHFAQQVVDQAGARTDV
jgi:hypothetical protein